MIAFVNLTINRSASILRTRASHYIKNPVISWNFKNALSSRLKSEQVFQNAKLLPVCRNYCTKAYEVNTNVAKDVILFKYENPKFYKILNIFGICQFIFWNYLCHFSFTTLKDAPVEANPEGELAWYQKINLGENKYRNALAICCFAIGYGILFAAWMFTLRSVRFLILRKGGKEISFVTYTPFGQNRIMTVPLKNVSAQESREIAKVQLPIKVQNRAFYYVLDMRGEFRNARLFDQTAGLKRKLL